MTTTRTMSRRAILGLSRPVDAPARASLARQAPLSGATQIGATRVAGISAACIEAFGVVCRACEGCCDAGAIRFRPRVGGGSTADVVADACTGCGDCELRCPVGAISLRPTETSGTET